MKKLAFILIGTLFSTSILANASALEYEDYVISGKTITVSGHIPVQNGELKYPGKIGETLSVEEGRKAAEIAAENVLNRLATAAGSLDNIDHCVKLTAYVNSAPNFTDLKLISNAASEKFIKALGDRGRHTRTTVGVASLPLNAAVEIEAICTLLKHLQTEISRHCRDVILMLNTAFDLSNLEKLLEIDITGNQKGAIGRAT